MAFPLNPINSEVYTNAMGTKYVYVSIDNKWIMQSQNLGLTGVQGFTGINGIDYGVTGVVNLTASYKYEPAPTGMVGFIQMPFNYQINNFVLVSNETGSMNMTVSKSTYSSHPTYTSMHGATGPRLLNQVKNTEINLVGKWSSPTGMAGDIIKVNIDTNNTVKSFLISLGYSRT